MPSAKPKKTRNPKTANIVINQIAVIALLTARRFSFDRNFLPLSPFPLSPIRLLSFTQLRIALFPICDLETVNRWSFPRQDNVAISARVCYIYLQRNPIALEVASASNMKKGEQPILVLSGFPPNTARLASREPRLVFSMEKFSQKRSQHLWQNNSNFSAAVVINFTKHEKSFLTSSSKTKRCDTVENGLTVSCPTAWNHCDRNPAERVPPRKYEAHTPKDVWRQLMSTSDHDLGFIMQAKHQRVVSCTGSKNIR